MKVLIAPDSFKDSMSSKIVCDVIEQAILEVNKNIEVIKVPMADGGEGTLDVLHECLNGKFIEVYVTGPLKNKVKSKYLMIDNNTAIIEMSSASGIELVPLKKRNPYYTTTFGIGEIILDSIKNGAKKIILGLGSSATNDAGVGMLMSLGAIVLDKNKKSIKLGGKYLKDIDSIDISNINNIDITGMCDVNNPLTGKKGSAYVFSKQKGATDEMIEKLDEGLKHFSNIIKKTYNKDIDNVEGAGSAGGLGASILLLNGELKKGIDTIIELTNLKDKMKDVDLVITGEGSIDLQTKLGKTPFGVAKLAKSLNKPVISFSGKLSLDVEKDLNNKIDAMFSIVNEPCTLEEAINKGEINLKNTVKNVFKLLNLHCNRKEF